VRAVIDLNVIISALIIPRGIPYDIWSAWLSGGAFTLIVSEGMILELTGKLAAPRIARRYGITIPDVQFVTMVLRTRGVNIDVPPEAIEPVSGDPEDDLVLATAHLGRADYLVTGDRRLLDLAHHRSVVILNPRAFLDQLP
jgi:putative PIN family toxin of toxin-antitoxin system